MMIIHWIAWFFGGIFLTNSVPHGVNGLMGRAFQSPFATPPGVGLSSSSANVLWAAINLIVAWLLILHVGAFDLRDAYDAAALGLGALMMSFMLARYFGKLHGGNAPEGLREGH
jgi:hypothetical protein